MSRPRLTEDQQDLPLPSGGPLEGLGAELQQRQHELIQLQRQQQELEIRKRQLEELNTRRMELMQGQKEIRDSLHRGVVILERAEAQSRKEVEQMHETRQIFSEQLAEINNIDPSEWSAAGIEEELSKALAKVDQAQAIYTQSRAKIDALRGQDLETQSEENSTHEGQVPTNAPESFGANLIRGFAFNLPLILALFLGLVLFHILK
jgi:DNA repair exonuclease SbcCD ATPase subunit